ncbi:expressed unknown protein [Seminavis robusta]|uniref:Uncharacterized protein n=1 Tax=Seminavis robusta TaxID=568900 RepID=A0A9N8DXJ6_9STRA|nr:expressed unknown protein [Seminavis robusta]|eukprot:Sro369_g128240.1 n/a (186) ;mRNA; r:47960-48613
MKRRRLEDSRVEPWLQQLCNRIGKMYDADLEVTDLSKATCTMALLAVGSIIVFATTNPAKKSQETVAVLTIYPALGAQLSQETRRKGSSSSAKNQRSQDNSVQMRNQLFLPRDQIVDCVVYEVIWSHKVMNVVALRIHATTTQEKSETQQQQTLKLIPVFPGTEMTYEECLYMRQEIIVSLDLPD